MGRLPDFAIVGAPKTGTTALFYWLSEHPELFLPPEKELHFFDCGGQQGLDWYRSRFADAGGRVAGEATPTYLGHATAIADLAELNPAIRLVVVLRDPIERAWSHYRYGLSRSYFQERFETLAMRELAGLARGEHGRSAPIWESLYGRHLERATHFVPREQILVLAQEDLIADPGAVFADLCSFLGVDETFRPSRLGEVILPTASIRAPRVRKRLLAAGIDQRLGDRGRSRFARVFSTVGYPEIDDVVRSALEEVFAEDQERLARWLAATTVEAMRPSLVA